MGGLRLSPNDSIENNDGSPVTLTGQTAAKVRANWNSSSGTPTLRDSLGVSSLTDRGTGQVTVNLTNSMSDDGYSPLGMSQTDTTTYNAFMQLDGNSSVSTGSYLVQTFSSGVGFVDVTWATTTVHGDLA